MAKKKTARKAGNNVDNAGKSVDEGELAHRKSRGAVKKGKKLTKAQRIAAKELARSLMMDGADMRKAADTIADTWGCSGGIGYKICKAARDDMIEEYKDETGYFAAESHVFYRRMSLDNEVENRDRINARKRLDELRGHDAPRRQSVEVQASTDVTALLQAVTGDLAPLPDRPQGNDKVSPEHIIQLETVKNPNDSKEGGDTSETATPLDE